MIDCRLAQIPSVGLDAGGWRTSVSTVWIIAECSSRSRLGLQLIRLFYWLIIGSKKHCKTEMEKLLRSWSIKFLKNDLELYLRPSVIHTKRFSLLYLSLRGYNSTNRICIEDINSNFNSFYSFIYSFIYVFIYGLFCTYLFSMFL